MADRNLEALWEVRDSLPREQRDEFVHTFIGSLSVNVEPAVWERSLRVAKEAVTRG